MHREGAEPAALPFVQTKRAAAAWRQLIRFDAVNRHIDWDGSLDRDNLKVGVAAEGEQRAVRAQCRSAPSAPRFDTRELLDLRDAFLQ
eukprot:7386424-Prymnesium_polylepis.3